MNVLSACLYVHTYMPVGSPGVTGLQMVVSTCVSAGNQTRVFCKSNMLCHLSSTLIFMSGSGYLTSNTDPLCFNFTSTSDHSCTPQCLAI